MNGQGNNLVTTRVTWFSKTTPAHLHVKHLFLFGLFSFGTQTRQVKIIHFECIDDDSDEHGAIRLQADFWWLGCLSLLCPGNPNPNISALSRALWSELPNSYSSWPPTVGMSRHLMGSPAHVGHVWSGNLSQAEKSHFDRFNGDIMAWWIILINTDNTKRYWTILNNTE